MNAKRVCPGGLSGTTEMSPCCDSRRVTYTRRLPGTIQRRDLEPKVSQEVNGCSQLEAHPVVLPVNGRSAWKRTGTALPGPPAEQLPEAPYPPRTGWLLGSLSWVASRGSHIRLVKLNHISKCPKDIILNDKLNDPRK